MTELQALLEAIEIIAGNYRNNIMNKLIDDCVP